MRCLTVCQDELIIRMLDEILLPGFDVEFIVESKPAARRLHDLGVHVVVGDPRRTETYIKADITPGTCVIIEDNGRRSLKKILEAVRDAGGTLVYVLGAAWAHRPPASASRNSRRVSGRRVLSMAELFGAAADRVQPVADPCEVLQYQRYFSDADRVLILLHNDPDPDAMASGLALRNVLHRTKTTAIIGAVQGVTRPENLRMLNLLDIHVEAVTPESVKEYSRIAMVDVQPHYFGGLIDRADLVIDHHPEQPGVRPCSRTSAPTTGPPARSSPSTFAPWTSTSRSERRRRCCTIKSDTLFFNRQTNRVDIEAFSYLYPLADAALIRKMEALKSRRAPGGRRQGAPDGHADRSGVLCVSWPTEREDFIPCRGFLSADRARQVDRHCRRRERDRHHLGAEPGLLQECRRIRPA
jgi:hypothetical protein